MHIPLPHPSESSAGSVANISISQKGGPGRRSDFTQKDTAGMYLSQDLNPSFTDFASTFLPPTLVLLPNKYIRPVFRGERQIEGVI